MNIDPINPPFYRFHRRRFLQWSGIAAAASTVWPTLAQSASAAETETAAQIVAGKDARLIVHSQNPIELETPLDLLRQHTITPKSLIFVRNNQGLDGTLSTAPVVDGQWSVELDGLVEFPRSLTVAELQKLEQVERTLVLQCSGNGRAFFSQASATSGSQWQNGAMANVRFKGVPLKKLIEYSKANVSPAAKFVTAEGKDSPVKAESADFEHSIPLDDALQRSIVALELNGEPLPAVHGGPLRLVTPGYYGTMNVKWLSRLRFESSETANHHQIKRYRTPLQPLAPGNKFDSTVDNSEPNWRMRIKSVIFSPLNDQQIKGGKVTVDGVAWNDGSARITAVEVSHNQGQTWRQTKLQTPDSPYAWYRWSIDLDLPAGDYAISSRAVDELGRTQPMEGSVNWNPAGYAWNGVQQIRVRVG